MSIDAQRVAHAAIYQLAHEVAGGVPSSGFGGWYDLESCRTNDRVIELTRRHYCDTVAALEQSLPAEGQEPLVVGGHEYAIPQLLTVFPGRLRTQFADSFLAGPRALTAAKARDLARVIANWTARRAPGCHRGGAAGGSDPRARTCRTSTATPSTTGG